MAPGHTSTIDQPHIRRGDALAGEIGARSPGCIRKVYRRLRNKIRSSWTMAWLDRSGTDGFGRIAARLASWGTAPYHGRASLADLTPRGFIAPTASVSHPGLHLGDNVYIGDNVVVSRCNGGGPITLQDQVHLYGDSFIETGMDGCIHVGEGTHIQPGCHLHAFLSDIRIGKRVEIASGCGFFSYDHGMELGQPIMDQPLKSDGGISVGDGAWLGYQVTVLQNVSIGAGAVIAAGSVVVRDIPENAIAAGVPARVVKFRITREPAGSLASDELNDLPINTHS